MNKILNKKINEKYKSLSFDNDIFRVLADESPNMIFINKRGRLVYVNKLCTDIMEYSEKEFLSEKFNFLKLISSDSIDRIKDAFKKHVEGIDIPPYEYKIVTKSGKQEL